ncbi:MerR family transcriptional regulator [Paenibacillus thermoaerophilus]|uniref:MerR family transcriptional regulator n=1 Tax=Paenibacillus thermoaerophilus TaxID=1215385 RepID=A0ABW2V814_9BACL|nr:MerR family transcriptional regulator [Paenibacillus thermoaerophilus]
MYRIGEVARMTGLSARTIDYYTKLSLIYPAKRSETNYRLYGLETIKRLKRIEEWKKEKHSLEEIKEKLDQLDKARTDEIVTDKLTSLQLHMKQLEREAKEIRPMLENLKPAQARSVLKLLTTQSAACIEALLILLGKGPLS